MKPRLQHVLLTSVSLLALGVFGLMAVMYFGRPPVVRMTDQPCVMLGLATSEGLEGPHLVVDCAGVQFGVKAVIP